MPAKFESPAKNDPPAIPTPAVMASANPPVPSPPAPSPSATPAGPVVTRDPPVPAVPPAPTVTSVPADPSATPADTPEVLEDLDARYYQRAGQIRRALLELANAQAIGLGTRVQAVRKELTELGYTGPETDITEGDRGPVGRSSRQQRAITTVGATTSAPTAQGASTNDPPPSTPNK